MAAGSKRQWFWQEEPDNPRERWANALGVSEVTARWLWQRGIRSPEQFREWIAIDGALDPPEQLPNLAAAVAALHEALALGRRIRVYGDYDADGVCATALMVCGLRSLSRDPEQVDYYIPNRFDEGYGLHLEAVEQAAADGVALLVTVDCGSSSPQAAERARALGLRLVITDHHALAAERPDAHALVNPELATPVERWAGAGVALQVVRALWGEEVPRRFYGICAIGTVADVVPMTTNNRRVVQRGLAALSDGQVPGVSALLRAAGRDLAHVSAEDLGFVVAPMINAAGRLGDATPAVELLLQDRVEAAAEWAQWLVQKNRERRTLQDRMLREAWAVLARDQHGRIFPFAVAAQAGWHEGLVGIVASRLKDLLKRPVAVISWDPSRKVGKGSARGVEGLDLISHLRRHAQHFINLGGHPGACGFSLRYQDASQLSQVFSRGLPAEALAQQHRDVRYDLRVQAAELTGRVARELKRLEPFGRGFERPRFLIHASVETAQAVGKDGGHLRLKLRDLPFPVVGFHLGHYAGGLASGQPVQFVGEMRWSLFRGREQPEVHIVAWDQSAPRVPSVTPAPGWPPPSAARRVFIVESTHAVIRVAEREHAIPFLPYATVAQWVDDVQRCRERDSGRIVVSQWRPWPPLWGWADAVVWLTRPVTRRRLEESGAFLRAGGQVWMADGTTTPERVSEKARRLLPTRDKLGRHWRRWGQGSSGLMIGRQIFRELGLDPGKPVLSGKVALASSFSYQWTWWAYREAVALGADHLSGREATRPPGESPSASG